MLRGTVKTLLQDHDVYITDWHNPRDIPLDHGRFGLDDYTEHLITFLGQLGPRPHMVAICQPSVSALAAAAIMSEDDHPARPASLTLMAGPIDTRILPTKVNEFAKSKPLKWFEDNLINYVPFQCKGAFRQVYPGFVQLTAFVSMNLERHIKQHIDLADHIAKGETEKAETIKTFYDEYFAVMDLPAEFYIETVRDVFQEHLLPLGKLTYRGRPVNCASIKRMGLMTVEGEKDDICSIGQTLAAQDLCTGVRAYRKVHHGGKPGSAITGHSAASAGTTKSIRCCGISCMSIREMALNSPAPRGRGRITKAVRVRAKRHLRYTLSSHPDPPRGRERERRCHQGPCKTMQTLVIKRPNKSREE